MLDLQNCCSNEYLSTVPYVSFYPSLIRFYLQIAYRKMRNLQIGVEKPLQMVSINLLHYINCTNPLLFV